MAQVLLFHHAQGQTAGFKAFADELRRAGPTVHTPDLYDGRTFATLEEGMAYAGKVGFPDEIIERGVRAANELPNELVYAGFSLGVLPAQKLAQTRPGARGALLFYSCVPTSAFGTPWRPRRCPRTRCVGRARRAVPLPRFTALFRRRQPAVLRRRRSRIAEPARARLPPNPLTWLRLCRGRTSRPRTAGRPTTGCRGDRR